MNASELKLDGLRRGLREIGVSKVIITDETKPWGGYALYQVDDNSDQKILYVRPAKPGEAMVGLSLQRHGSNESDGHSEYWQFFTPATVVLGDSLNNLSVHRFELNDRLFIPGGRWHALCTPDSEVIVREQRISPPGVTQTYQEREANIERLYDTWRTGTSWPEDLVARIKSRI